MSQVMETSQAALPEPGRARGPTLMGHLLAWVLAVLMLVWAGYMGVGWQTGTHEAQELTDGYLASATALLLSQRSIEFSTPLSVSAPPSDLALRSHDYQQSLSVQVWDGAGRVLAHSGAAPGVVFDAAEGFSTLALGQPPAHWRTFARWDSPAHGRKVMVLLSMAERDELAWDIAEPLATTGLWLLPIVALVLGLAIRRGLRPLAQLSREVAALDVRSAEPLPDGPRVRQAEFQAVVGAINTLVVRYQLALARERELAGELAHELRTPLASLALQAGVLKGVCTEPERLAALARVERDALHAGEVLRHMLALARASHTELAESAQVFDVAERAREVLGSYAQSALDAGHELALQGAGALWVRGHPVLLDLALRNLIENALSHAAPGAEIEVQVHAAARWVQVCDDGGRGAAEPGPRLVAPTASLGLGLGQRVIEKIAMLHGARWESLPSPTGPGRCDRLTFGALASP